MLRHNLWNIRGVKYTAISIYVVGSKLQGYGTRPKGGMGRLELIVLGDIHKAAATSST